MTHARETSNVRLHATVRGMVQGVSFRAYTQIEAVRLGLTGWVANRPDGSVEVVAEGPRSAVERLERFLHRGPRMAEVEQVEASYHGATEEFSGFNIRY